MVRALLFAAPIHQDRQGTIPSSMTVAVREVRGEAMNRRQFIALGTSSLLWLPSGNAGARQGTPAATFVSAGRPDPIDLGHGITLIDYRVYPSAPNHKVIGEIHNDNNHMVDAPVVSMTYPAPSSAREGFAYASPIVPVMGPERTVPVFGVLPDTDTPEETLRSAAFALCSPVEYGEYSEQQAELSLTMTMGRETIEPQRYAIPITMSNAGGTTVTDIAVRGIFRDANGRVAGCSERVLVGRLLVGEEREFWVSSGIGEPVKADPFVLIPNRNYSVDIIAGTRGPVIPRSCTSAKK